MSNSASKDSKDRPLKERVSTLEEMMMRLVYIQQKTEMGMQSLQKEMKDFKDEMNKRWGELANNMGTIIEDIVAPNIPTIAQRYFNCSEIDQLLVNAYVRNKQRTKAREFDVIAVCNDLVILNETKRTTRKNYIDDCITLLQSGEFFDYFPYLKGKKLIPIFSSLKIQEDLIDYLTKNDIYCMVMKGNTMDIVNYSVIESKKNNQE